VTTRSAAAAAAAAARQGNVIDQILLRRCLRPEKVSWVLSAKKEKNKSLENIHRAL